MSKIKLFIAIFLSIISFFFAAFAGWPAAAAAEENYACAVYFTGIGCPHCAAAAPTVYGETLSENPNFMLVEYEIYQQSANASLIYEYNSDYGSGLGIPLMVFNEDQSLVGGSEVAKGVKDALLQYPNNDCPLKDGQTVGFNQLDIAELPGAPKIWRSGRILIAPPEQTEIDSALLRNLMTAEIKDLSNVLKGAGYETVSPEAADISGGRINFEHAIELGKTPTGERGWIFQWNGEELSPSVGEITGNENGSVKLPVEDGALLKEKLISPKEGKSLNILSIVSLAAVDAVNPCALAVLLLMLVSILTYNPKNKKRILFSGLSFAAAVFILYFFYGLVIIRFFRAVQAITFVRLWLYKFLGAGAVVLGILNIRDYLKYRPGRLGTEMPLFMRPKVKKIISGATGPKGAFVVGAFVTLFLLPCTIGPYIICGGALCSLSILKAVPWLLLYNLIFIVPMLIITAIVYGGVAKVEDVAGWKDKNIRRLHLVSGLIILLLGAAMLLGWV